MSIIPNIIHFIWVGKVLPNDPQAKNLAKWMVENPLYQFYLWGQKHNLHNNLKVVAEEMMQHIESGTVTSMLTTREMAGFDMTVGVNSEETPLKLFSRPIGLLRPMMGTESILQEELGTWQNYGAVSDIARIWALFNYGGIYMDFDTYSTNRPLPLNIEAPRDILFGIGNPGEPDAIFTNAVIATPPIAQPLVDIAMLMAQKYHPEYKPVTEGITRFNTAGRQRLAEVKRIRKKKVKSDASKKEREQLFWEILAKKTVQMTGPGMLVDWSEEIEGVFPAHWDFDLYSFQVQSGYPIRIESEGTWVK